MKYIVRRYFSAFCTFHVEAENSDGAFETARRLQINEGEILSTLQDWKDCDEVEELSTD